MAYDLDLVNRVRELLAREPDVSEKSMFGGLAFLVEGKMSATASRQGGLLVRVDPDDADDLAGHAHARRYVMRGREMTNWLHIDAVGLTSDDQLAAWVGRGVTYARALAAT